MDLQELRKQADDIRSQKSIGKKVYWPASFRNKVADLVIAGHSPNTLSSITQIAVSTLYTWKKRKTAESKKQFKQVKVIEDTTLDLTLTWQAGLSIKGLTFNQIKELLTEG